MHRRDIWIPKIWIQLDNTSQRRLLSIIMIITIDLDVIDLSAPIACHCDKIILSQIWVIRPPFWIIMMVKYENVLILKLSKESEKTAKMNKRTYLLR